MSERDPRDVASQAEQVLRLWVRNHSDVSRYVFSLLPNAADVQDVLQATCVALWKKAAELDLERPFLPLAFRFALLEVRKHREKNRRWATLIDDATLDVLAQERDASLELLERRRQALEGCLGRLGTRDSELLERFYRKQMTVPEIAAATGRNLHTLYKALQRIRRQLHDCIDSRLRAEGST